MKWPRRRRPKVSLSVHCFVNYETKMAAELWRHLVHAITVVKAKHLEFGLTGYANIFMMLSACFSCLLKGLQLKPYLP